MTKTELINLHKSLSCNEVLVLVTKSKGNWLMINSETIVNNKGYNYLNYLNENLINRYDLASEYSIIEIHKTHLGLGFTKALNLETKSELIWKREEEHIELTLDQIAEKFGVNVKNLKIKK